MWKREEKKEEKEECNGEGKDKGNTNTKKEKGKSREDWKKTIRQQDRVATRHEGIKRQREKEYKAAKGN